MKIGVQTYTIRKAQKKSFEHAYLPLIRLGIKAFELSRMKFTKKNADTIHSLIQQHDIHIVSIQAKPKDVFHHRDELVEFCHRTGCKNVVLSMLPFHCIFGSEKVFYEFVSELDSLAEIYQKHGITLAYHHHDWEYERCSNGKTRMDELIERTHKIQFVHDTYWTVRCGYSSVEQVQKFGSRLLGIHLRDLVLYRKGLRIVMKDGAVGTGIIDFQSILNEAEKVQCSYAVIEQNTKHPYEDITLSFKTCLQYAADRKEKHHE